jgi:hypothetical protein
MSANIVSFGCVWVGPGVAPCEVEPQEPNASRERENSGRLRHGGGWRMLPDNPLSKWCWVGMSSTLPPSIAPPAKPTSELGMVVVKGKNN